MNTIQEHLLYMVKFRLAVSVVVRPVLVTHRAIHHCA